MSEIPGPDRESFTDDLADVNKQYDQLQSDLNDLVGEMETGSQVMAEFQVNTGVRLCVMCISDVNGEIEIVRINKC